MHKITDTIEARTTYERDVRNHASRSYRSYMLKNFWKRIIPTKNKTNIEEIELTDVLEYVVYYKTTPMKNTWHKIWTFPTRNAEYNVISAIRCLFRYCNVVWMKLQFNREQIPIFKQDDVKREPMSKEDFQSLHVAIAKYSKSEEIKLRDELMIEIPRETWLRRAEIVQLRFSDFHNANRQFRVVVKWNRLESVFFSKELQKKVFEYEALLNEKYKLIDIEKLFICLWQKEKWKEFTDRLLWHHFTKLVAKMKEDWMIPQWKRLSLHSERHSFAMRCVYSWLSQQATTQLMRHKDPKITLHYYHMNDTRLLNQYDSISV